MRLHNFKGTRARRAITLISAAFLALACAEGSSDENEAPFGFSDASAGVGQNPGGTGGGSASGGGGLPGSTPGSASGGVAGTGGGAAGGGISGDSGNGGTSDGGTVSSGEDSGSGGGSTLGGDGGASSGPLAELAKPLPAGKAFGEWTWVEPAGAKCRDGSPAGYYWRRGQENKVLIFLNGGGACSDPFFCSLNPKNVNEDLPTQSLIDATGNVLLGPDKNRQIAPDEGVFKRDPKNPVGKWSMIYVPYCTGDVFAGQKPNGTVPGFDGPQQFVGYTNIGLFLESFGPSFANAEKVLLTGSSAGGFGTLLNYDRTQEFFNQWNIRVYGVTDSGIPFRDKYMPACLQKRWRDTWNLDAALPKDCTACFRADGGGLAEGLGDYLFHNKYKDRALGGLISSVEDGIIRAFFGAGNDDCKADPGTNTILSALNLGGYSGQEYRDGLKDVVDFVGKDKISTYFIDSWEHMHLWRARYYQAVGGVTIADWLGKVLEDKPTHVGTP